MDVTLTGPHDTGQLAAITVEPVTVTVERSPNPAFRREFAAALSKLAAAAEQAPGSLGAGVLAGAGGDDPWHVVFRFQDAVALRRWEASEERQKLLGQVQLYTTRTKVVSAPSPDAWFAASDVPVESTVGKWARDVMWTLPIAALLTVTVVPLFGSLPVVVRVVLSTGVGAALYAGMIAPTRRWWRQRVVRKKPLV